MSKFKVGDVVTDTRTCEIGVIFEMSQNPINGEVIAFVEFNEYGEQSYTESVPEKFLAHTTKAGAETKLKEFESLVRPLIKFLNDHYHPHVTIIVTPTGAELMEGIGHTGEITEYVRD